MINQLFSSYALLHACFHIYHANNKWPGVEKMSRDAIKAEFGKVKALDYLLQRFSVAPLAIQCHP